MTYSQVLEEPGNLEIAQKGLTGVPKLKRVLQLRRWSWNTAPRRGGRPSFTCKAKPRERLDHLHRLSLGEPLSRAAHRTLVNPVLYLEYEDMNGADKSVLEVAGHDSISDLQVTGTPRAVARSERTMEGKLILSSNAEGLELSPKI